MKPYAWINVNDEYKILFDDELPTYYPEAWMPLYTHPAKTLTDEEILNIFNNWTNSKQEHNLPAGNIDYFHQEMIEFARAILRKAQEK